MDTPDLTTTKRCAKCGVVKLRSDFHRDKNRSDGRYAYCKACACARTKEWVSANRERKAEQDKAWVAANKERKAATDKAWRKANHERNAAIHRAWQEANQDHVKEYRNINRERITANRKAYNETNRERRAAKYRAWYDSNRERRAETRRENPGIYKAATQRYKARKRGLENTLTTADWQVALDYFGGGCAACGRQQGLWHTLAADHWIPLSKDGPTTPDNIVPLCHGVGGCNNSKRDRDPAEWLTERFGPRKGRAILQRIETYLNSRKQ